MKYINNYKIFETKVQYFGYKVVRTEPITKLDKFKNHRRLRVFYNKGVECCKCGVVADQIVYGEDKGGNIHIDVCTHDFYPLTIDHIIPRSKGGTDDLDNLRPMCCICNWERGNDDNSTVHKKKYEPSIALPKNGPKLV